MAIFFRWPLKKDNRLGDSVFLWGCFISESNEDLFLNLANSIMAL